MEINNDQNIFKMWPSYLEIKISVSICTDSTASMTGFMKGFTSLAKSKQKKSSHHIFHREVLTSKILRNEMKYFLRMLQNSFLNKDKFTQEHLKNYMKT